MSEKKIGGEIYDEVAEAKAKARVESIMKKRKVILSIREEKKRGENEEIESEEHKKEEEENEVLNNLRQEVKVLEDGLDDNGNWFEHSDDYKFFIGVGDDEKKYGINITENGEIGDAEDLFKRPMTEQEEIENNYDHDDDDDYDHNEVHLTENTGVSANRKIYRDEIVRIYRERFPNQDTEEKRKTLELGYGIRIIDDSYLDLVGATGLELGLTLSTQRNVEREYYVKEVVESYRAKFRNQDVEVAKIIYLLTKREREEALEKAVKFQSGRSEGESFIGYAGGDGNFGLFIDERGNLIDGEDNFVRSREGLKSREIVGKKILELYKEKFPKKNIDEIKESIYQYKR